MLLKKVAASAAAALVMSAASLGVAASELVVNGSTTVLPIVQKALESYAKEPGAADVSLSGGGSGNGIKALVDGLTHVAMSSRDIKSSEVDLAKSHGVNPYRIAVAVDAIVPVVNNSNTVKDLTLEQLKQIYEGKIRNWKEVGGKNAPIVVVSRDSSSGTFETWEELVMKKARVTPRALLQTSNGTVVQTISKNRNAIGYIGLGYVDKQTKALTIDGAKATAATAKAKQWPLSRELYFFTNGEPQGDVKHFTSFMLEAGKGQKLVKETGFVPVHE